jgi:hypothetical protein
MRVTERVPEAVMVAAFLKAEFRSGRYGPVLQGFLDRDGRGPDVLDRPNLGEESENAYRAGLLAAYRGYGRDGDVFKDMPPDVEWVRAELDSDDLDRLIYIDDDYWTGFTGGSRRVRDAVERVRTGEINAGEAAPFRSIADAARRGERFPEPILLHNPVSGELVILEGHKRMTGYLLLPDPLPRDLLRVIVGRSDRLKK